MNENAPKGTVVTQVNATDVDFEAAHKTVYYVIVDGNADGVFGIGRENGTVYVANTTSIDRETKSSYELEIEARTLNEFMNVTVQQTTTKVSEFTYTKCACDSSAVSRWAYACVKPIRSSSINLSLLSPFSTRRLFSREVTFSFVGVAYHISKCDADKGKSRFARKKSPSGKRALDIQ